MPRCVSPKSMTVVDKDEIEHNIQYSTEMMHWLLQIMGLWPNIAYPKIFRVLLIGLVSTVMILFTVPIALNILLVVKDFKTMLKLVGPLSFALMCIFKYIVVLLQEGQLCEFLEWIANDWRSVHSPEENSLMLENAKSARTFTTFCSIIMYISGTSYSALFSFMMSPIVVNNKTTRLFAVPSYFVFFDPHDHFPEVYTLQAVAGYIQFTITSAVASIAVACVMHVCGQIAVTSWMLRNVNAGSFDATIFGRLVDKHLRAITLAKKLEDYLNSMCLIELMGCCFNICMLGYYFITVYRNQNLVLFSTYCVLFVSFTFNMFIFCYIGEQLTEKSSKFQCGNIGSAAYNVDWYCLSAKDAKYLLMTVASTKRPVVLTAGKFATLSMASFSSILKTSFSYLNMLKTVTCLISEGSSSQRADASVVRPRSRRSPCALAEYPRSPRRASMSKAVGREEPAEVDESETAKNYEQSVKTMRLLLQSMGMWPITSPTYPSSLRFFFIATAFLLLLLFLLPIGLQTFYIVDDLKERVRNVGPFTFGVMNVIKYTTVIARKDKLRECLDWLASDWRRTKKRAYNELMLSSAETGLAFTAICASFMLVGGMAYTCLFSFIQERVVVNNVSRRAFSYPGYFVFFDPHDHFYKIYALQSMCGYVAFATTAAVASIAVAFAMHICGQLSVVSYMIRSLASRDFDKEAFQRTVEKHLRALSLAKKLEDFLSGICMVEMLGCCFCICLTGYYAVTEFDLHNLAPYTYCVLMVSFTFNIFTFCYIGEQLSEQCSNIGNVVYNVSWYRLSSNDARSLLMIIMSTHRPVVLTAGKMTSLSILSFSKVLKASLTYLNMLRTVTNY
ncbi:uncharacterized protein LOC131672509 [Phymastichus coffea]|uniref:uncharacterized protein LOC131672509 n=1 Tax=Phymastichus coffea TaxID=108790 RepID=UPI00273C5642|nr:uncharacterized protein LOC131672509 [Phymastichus coffea]